jgi:hypothetical protein
MYGRSDTSESGKTLGVEVGSPGRLDRMDDAIATYAQPPESTTHEHGSTRVYPSAAGYSLCAGSFPGVAIFDCFLRPASNFKRIDTKTHAASPINTSPMWSRTTL